MTKKVNEKKGAHLKNRFLHEDNVVHYLLIASGLGEKRKHTYNIMESEGNVLYLQVVFRIGRVKKPAVFSRLSVTNTVRSKTIGEVDF